MKQNTAVMEKSDQKKKLTKSDLEFLEDLDKSLGDIKAGRVIRVR